ncbi:MAG: carbamoyltransferase HypF [Eubacteriales bacterium]|nr:carbamoyltransferase HypF [Eubacteriales bacterium]
MRRFLRVRILGLVQGVGFRPFLHRLAERTGISGWARNTSGGLEAVCAGEPGQLEAFLSGLLHNPPPLAQLRELQTEELSPEQAGPLPEGFEIRKSRILPRTTFAGADTAPCPACRKELFSPGDRRFHYPFLNCTDCGPRYSILLELPYDRSRTVMERFPMCPDCRREYGDIRSRRYHAQPNCCPSCGPRAFLTDASGQPADRSADPFPTARRLLSEGKILAVKGTGGIHLACDAENEAAVARLREKKGRPSRPLALMAQSLDSIREICFVSDGEAAQLTAPARPILLLRKRSPELFPWISFGHRIGVMLPYSPLHLLLLAPDCPGPRLLVMTSANEKGAPVLTKSSEALEKLSGTADFFLLHNRPIANRCDDSVALWQNGSLSFFRRSRGFAPLPVSCSREVSGVCAFGAEQKASFALGREKDAFLSPHIGDLKNMETLDHYRQALQTFGRLFGIRPTQLVCDLHPDYFSTLEAQETARREKLPLLQVQHHWAHMVSCMEDNLLSGPAFGIVWDGTGLGDDGAVWGAEFLTGDARSFLRVGSLRPMRLPGGDLAAAQIWRIGLGLLEDAQILPGALSTGGAVSGAFPFPDAWPAGQIPAVCTLLSAKIACPKASSMGRLFDGVFSLIGGMANGSFDGEAPQRLEALCPEETPSREELEAPPFCPLVFYEENGVRRFDTRPLIRAVWTRLRCGVPAALIARDFQLALCHMALEQCRSLNPERLPVVLSGGVFLNVFLTDGIRRLLQKDGYRVFCHRRVSACDEGISLGQLAIAAARDTTA